MAVSKKKGERAMAFISDYPLYANTCGITYDQAVKVAKAILGTNWEYQLDELDKIEQMTEYELKQHLGLLV